MNKKEVDALILTHYENESQTLTSDAEANLLKLKEMAGLISQSEATRWQHIKEIFIKNNKLGGINKENQAGQVIAQLADFNDNLEGIRKALTKGK